MLISSPDFLGYKGAEKTGINIELRLKTDVSSLMLSVLVSLGSTDSLSDWHWHYL